MQRGLPLIFASTAIFSRCDFILLGEHGMGCAGGAAMRRTVFFNRRRKQSTTADHAVASGIRWNGFESGCLVVVVGFRIADAPPAMLRVAFGPNPASGEPGAVHRCDTSQVGGTQEQSFDSRLRAFASVQPWPLRPKDGRHPDSGHSRREKIGWAQCGHNLGICAQSWAGAQICTSVTNNSFASIALTPRSE